ncbi:MAG: hypothetical protein JWM73_1515 [Solirubrobacterales bacterium]|nr:hypothetical protein [Solirubrobacterales bacterium]
MRRNTTLDPIVAAELDERDAVLAGERRDPALSLIADEARASAEPMPPGLALRLEAALGNGFALSRPRRRDPWWSKALAPAGGLAAVVVLVVVFATVGGDSGGNSSDSGSSSGGTALVAPNADSAASGSSTAAKDTGQSSSSVAAPSLPPEAARDAAGIPRRVQRAADLTIATPSAKLQDTSDAVGRTADRLGGYVQRSDVAARGGSGQATFDLRIPAARLDEALATLARLGHVRSRTQQSQDITARFVSARSRLQDARAERQALLRALAEATTSQEIDSINGRLDIARARIAAAKGDLFGARRAANMARVGVTVVGVAGDEGATGAGGGDWTPGQALEDALGVLSVATGVLIVALAGAVPAALVAMLALLAWRAHRRRSRELALEPGTPV